MKRLDHPNVIKIYELYECPQRFYLVMELCTGGELFDEMSRGSNFSEKQAARYMGMILNAIAYYHQEGIVHRDIKPENILIESKKTNILKIKDFSASAFLKHNIYDFENRQFLQTVVGSPYTIAPEVLLTEYTEKCDLWSCGVILYMMLAGKPPFDGENELEILE